MSLLKSLIDHGGNYYTLHKLVFRDVRSQEVKAKIIKNHKRCEQAVRGCWHRSHHRF